MEGEENKESQEYQSNGQGKQTKQIRTLRIIIKGKVQGVGFRFFLRQKALLLGINGYAMNKNDGSLEVIAQSRDNNALKKFVLECKRGPMLAVIEDVVVEEINETRGYEGFNIR